MKLINTAKKVTALFVAFAFALSPMQIGFAGVADLTLVDPSLNNTTPTTSDTTGNGLSPELINFLASGETAPAYTESVNPLSAPTVIFSGTVASVDASNEIRASRSSEISQDPNGWQVNAEMNSLTSTMPDSVQKKETESETTYSWTANNTNDTTISYSISKTSNPASTSMVVTGGLSLAEGSQFGAGTISIHNDSHNQNYTFYYNLSVNSLSTNEATLGFNASDNSNLELRISDTYGNVLQTTGPVACQSNSCNVSVSSLPADTQLISNIVNNGEVLSSVQFQTPVNPAINVSVDYLSMSANTNDATASFYSSTGGNFIATIQDSNYSYATQSSSASCSANSYCSIYVSGLNSGSNYNVTISAQDANTAVVGSPSTSFTTATDYSYYYYNNYYYAPSIDNLSVSFQNSNDPTTASLSFNTSSYGYEQFSVNVTDSNGNSISQDSIGSCYYSCNTTLRNLVAGQNYQVTVQSSSNSYNYYYGYYGYSNPTTTSTSFTAPNPNIYVASMDVSPSSNDATVNINLSGNSSDVIVKVWDANSYMYHTWGWGYSPQSEMTVSCSGSCSANLSGLSSNTAYVVELVSPNDGMAINLSGTTTASFQTSEDYSYYNYYDTTTTSPSYTYTDISSLSVSSGTTDATVNFYSSGSTSDLALRVRDSYGNTQSESPIYCSGSCSMTVSNLNSNTNYTAEVVVANSNGYVYLSGSTTTSFQTSAPSIYVASMDVSTSSNSATVNINLSGTSSDVVVKVWDSNSYMYHTWGWSWITPQSETTVSCPGSCNANLNNLSSNTAYVVELVSPNNGTDINLSGTTTASFQTSYDYNNYYNYYDTTTTSPSYTYTDISSLSVSSGTTDATVNFYSSNSTSDLALRVRDSYGNTQSESPIYCSGYCSMTVSNLNSNTNYTAEVVVANSSNYVYLSGSTTTSFQTSTPSVYVSSMDVSPSSNDATVNINLSGNSSDVIVKVWEANSYMYHTWGWGYSPQSEMTVSCSGSCSANLSNLNSNTAYVVELVSPNNGMAINLSGATTANFQTSTPSVNVASMDVSPSTNSAAVNINLSGASSDVVVKIWDANSYMYYHSWGWTWISPQSETTVSCSGSCTANLSNLNSDTAYVVELVSPNNGSNINLSGSTTMNFQTANPNIYVASMDVSPSSNDATVNINLSGNSSDVIVKVWEANSYMYHTWGWGYSPQSEMTVSCSGSCSANLSNLNSNTAYVVELVSPNNGMAINLSGTTTTSFQTSTPSVYVASMDVSPSTNDATVNINLSGNSSDVVVKVWDANSYMYHNWGWSWVSPQSETTVSCSGSCSTNVSGLSSNTAYVVELIAPNNGTGTNLSGATNASFQTSYDYYYYDSSTPSYTYIDVNSLSVSNVGTTDATVGFYASSSSADLTLRVSDNYGNTQSESPIYCWGYCSMSVSNLNPNTNYTAEVIVTNTNNYIYLSGSTSTSFQTSSDSACWVNEFGGFATLDDLANFVQARDFAGDSGVSINYNTGYTVNGYYYSFSITGSQTENQYDQNGNSLFSRAIIQPLNTDDHSIAMDDGRILNFDSTTGTATVTDSSNNVTEHNNVVLWTTSRDICQGDVCTPSAVFPPDMPEHTSLGDFTRIQIWGDGSVQTERFTVFSKETVGHYDSVPAELALKAQILGEVDGMLDKGTEYSSCAEGSTECSKENTIEFYLGKDLVGYVQYKHLFSTDTGLTSRIVETWTAINGDNLRTTTFFALSDTESALVASVLNVTAAYKTSVTAIVNCDGFSGPSCPDSTTTEEFFDLSLLTKQGYSITEKYGDQSSVKWFDRDGVQININQPVEPINLDNSHLTLSNKDTMSYDSTTKIAFITNKQSGEIIEHSNVELYYLSSQSCISDGDCIPGPMAGLPEDKALLMQLGLLNQLASFMRRAPSEEGWADTNFLVYKLPSASEILAQMNDEIRAQAANTLPAGNFDYTFNKVDENGPVIGFKWDGTEPGVRYELNKIVDENGTITSWVFLTFNPVEAARNQLLEKANLAATENQAAIASLQAEIDRINSSNLAQQNVDAFKVEITSLVARLQTLMAQMQEIVNSDRPEILNAAAMADKIVVMQTYLDNSLAGEMESYENFLRTSLTFMLSEEIRQRNLWANEKLSPQLELITNAQSIEALQALDPQVLEFILEPVAIDPTSNPTEIVTQLLAQGNQLMSDFLVNLPEGHIAVSEKEAADVIQILNLSLNTVIGSKIISIANVACVVGPCDVTQEVTTQYFSDAAHLFQPLGKEIKKFNGLKPVSISWLNKEGGLVFEEILNNPKLPVVINTILLFIADRAEIASRLLTASTRSFEIFPRGNDSKENVTKILKYLSEKARDFKPMKKLIKKLDDSKPLTERRQAEADEKTPEKETAPAPKDPSVPDTAPIPEPGQEPELVVNIPGLSYDLELLYKNVTGTTETFYNENRPSPNFTVFSEGLLTFANTQNTPKGLVRATDSVEGQPQPSSADGQTTFIGL